MSDQNLHPKEPLCSNYENPQKALWICTECDKPLGDEGLYDTYHQACCPKCREEKEK